MHFIQSILDNPTNAITFLSLCLCAFFIKHAMRFLENHYNKFEKSMENYKEEYQEINDATKKELKNNYHEMLEFRKNLLRMKEELFDEIETLKSSLSSVDVLILKQNINIERFQKDIEELYGRLIRLEKDGEMRISAFNERDLIIKATSAIKEKNAEIAELKRKINGG